MTVFIPVGAPLLIRVEPSRSFNSTDLITSPTVGFPKFIGTVVSSSLWTYVVVLNYSNYSSTAVFLYKVVWCYFCRLKHALWSWFSGVFYFDGRYTNGDFLGNFPLKAFVARLNKNHGNKWTVIDLLWYGRTESNSDEFRTEDWS